MMCLEHIEGAPIQAYFFVHVVLQRCKHAFGHQDFIFVDKELLGAVYADEQAGDISFASTTTKIKC
jgi:hypothetical protein